MNDLEMQVRQALVETMTEEYRQQLSDPVYIKKAGAVFVDIVREISGAIAEEVGAEGNEGELKGLETMMMTVVVPEMQALIQSPDFRYFNSCLKQQQSPISKIVGEESSGYEAMFTDLYETALGGVLDAGLQKKCVTAFKELFKVSRVNDRIINRLVRIAEKDGVAKAVEKETRYGVLREFFETPEEYRAHVNKVSNKVLNALIEFVPNLQQAVPDEEGKVVMSFVGTVMAKMLDKANAVMKDEQEKRIREIYGTAWLDA